MAPPRGFRHSPETRARMSASRRGKRPSPETKAKISTTLTGHPVSEDARARMRGVRAANPVYSTVHVRHLRHWPKAGVCERCGGDAPTEWAWQRHGEIPGGFSDDRADYAEMCRSCHRQADIRARKATA